MERKCYSAFEINPQGLQNPSLLPDSPRLFCFARTLESMRLTKTSQSAEIVLAHSSMDHAFFPDKFSSR